MFEAIRLSRIESTTVPVASRTLCSGGSFRETALGTFDHFYLLVKSHASQQSLDIFWNARRKTLFVLEFVHVRRDLDGDGVFAKRCRKRVLGDRVVGGDSLFKVFADVAGYLSKLVAFGQNVCRVLRYVVLTLLTVLYDRLSQKKVI